MPESYPLHDKYPDLHHSDPVEAAVDRQARLGDRRAELTGEPAPKPPTQPADKIESWMDTLEHIHIGRDPKTADRIKAVYHKQFVMQPDQVPESYFDLQKRIAREEGHGDVQIPEQVRLEMGETITRDQERSLDVWIDYLSSEDATYPMWFKYYTFRNIVKLADYDKNSHEFKKRSKSTTGPFPDLDREALAYMSDALQKHYGITDTSLEGEPDEINPDIKELLDKDASFPKLYARTIELIQPASPEELSRIEGEWVKYDQGTDGGVLAKTIQGHGTGWCTAGEGTAQAQLAAGDFYVYYSKDTFGENKIPRVAIRMQGGQIAEVRGIEVEQNLEPLLVEIAKEKMSSLPGAEEYEKAANDMARVTELERKINNNETLSRDDLVFLYGDIQGFGYEDDPRVAELQAGRDWFDDMAVIVESNDPIMIARYALGTDAEKLAVNLARFHNLPGDIADKLVDLQRYEVIQNLDRFIDVDEQKIAYEIAKFEPLELIITNLDKFHNLDQNKLLKDLMMYSMAKADKVARLANQFPQVNLDDIADTFMEQRFYSVLARNLEQFPSLDHNDLADKMLTNNLSELAAELPHFKDLDARFADELISRGHPARVASSITSFRPEAHPEIAERLLESGNLDLVAHNQGLFEKLNKNTISNIIASGYALDILAGFEKYKDDIDQLALLEGLVSIQQINPIVENIDVFDQVPRDEIARRIKQWSPTYADLIFAHNLDKFPDEDQDALVDRLLERHQITLIIDNFEKFSDIDYQSIANACDVHLLADHLSRFKGLNTETAQRIITYHTLRGDEVVAKNLASFEDPKAVQEVLDK